MVVTKTWDGTTIESSKSITISFVRHGGQLGGDKNSSRGLFSLFIWDHGDVPVRETMAVLDCMAIRREPLARQRWRELLPPRNLMSIVSRGSIWLVVTILRLCHFDVA